MMNWSTYDSVTFSVMVVPTPLYVVESVHMEKGLITIHIYDSVILG